MPFRYDRGIDRADRQRGRRGKHESDADEPYFDYDSKEGAWVGKCPRGLDDAFVQSVLDEAIPQFRSEEPEPNEFPLAFFAVIDGVPYTTRRTNAEARTVHGFPWMFREPGGMPRRIRRMLEARATLQGRLDRFQEWMKRYGQQPLAKPRPR